jgi:DnaJ-class molecular chaperone
MSLRVYPYPGSPSQALQAGFCPGCGGTGKVEKFVPVAGTYICSTCNGGGTVVAMEAAISAL